MNRNGNQGVNQSAWRRGPASSIIVPSDDWCMVGSRTPRAMIQTPLLLTKRRAFLANAARRGFGLASIFSHSAGESSMSSTKLYNMTQMATSSCGEWLQCQTKTGIFHRSQ